MKALDRNIGSLAKPEMIERYVQTWINSIDRTRDRLRTMLMKIHKWYGQRPFDPKLLPEFAGWVRTTFAPSYAGQISGKTRMYLTWCRREGYLVNPKLMPMLGDGIRPERPTYTPEEVRRMIALFRQTPDLWRYDWDYAITVAWHTGFRLSDVAQLQWRCVDMANGVIRMSPHKTRRLGKVVEIPFGEELRAEFERMKVERPDPVWVNEFMRLGYVSGRQRQETEFAKFCLYCGIPDKRFHNFRHSFITRLLERNVSPVLVSNLAGINLKEVMTYERMGLDSKRDALGIGAGGGSKLIGA